jgi:hypothetical protein
MKKNMSTIDVFLDHVVINRTAVKIGERYKSAMHHDDPDEYLNGYRDEEPSRILEKAARDAGISWDLGYDTELSITREKDEYVVKIETFNDDEGEYDEDPIEKGRFPVSNVTLPTFPDNIAGYLEIRLREESGPDLIEKLREHAPDDIDVRRGFINGSDGNKLRDWVVTIDLPVGYAVTIKNEPYNAPNT